MGTVCTAPGRYYSACAVRIVDAIEVPTSCMLYLFELCLIVVLFHPRYGIVQNLVT